MTTAERQDYAAKLKREMNCCQAVVRAFADTVSLDEATLTSLAAGFGSRMMPATASVSLKLRSTFTPTPAMPPLALRIRGALLLVTVF